MVFFHANIDFRHGYLAQKAEIPNKHLLQMRLDAPSGLYWPQMVVADPIISFLDVTPSKDGGFLCEYWFQTWLFSSESRNSKQKFVSDVTHCLKGWLSIQMFVSGMTWRQKRVSDSTLCLRMQYYVQPLVPDTTRMPSRLGIQPYRRHFQLSDTADGWSVSVIEVLNCHFHQHSVCKEEWKCVCSELWALHHLPHLTDVFHRDAEAWCLKHSFVSARLTSPITQPAAMK